jgi:hypothetical protein
MNSTNIVAENAPMVWLAAVYSAVLLSVMFRMMFRTADRFTLYSLTIFFGFFIGLGAMEIALVEGAGVAKAFIWPWAIDSAIVGSFVVLRMMFRRT